MKTLNKIKMDIEETITKDDLKTIENYIKA